MDSPDDDWDDKPTRVDPSLAETNPHRSLDWLGGREAGFTEGVNRALAAFGRELDRIGFQPHERALAIARVRRGALRRG